MEIRQELPHWLHNWLHGKDVSASEDVYGNRRGSQGQSGVDFAILCVSFDTTALEAFTDCEGIVLHLSEVQFVYVLLLSGSGLDDGFSCDEGQSCGLAAALGGLGHTHRGGVVDQAAHGAVASH